MKGEFPLVNISHGSSLGDLTIHLNFAIKLDRMYLII